MSQKSESVSRTIEPSLPVIQPRVALLERVDILEGLSPTVIAALHKELNENRREWETKMLNVEIRSDNRVRAAYEMAARERLESEKLRLSHQGSQWETASDASR